MRSFEFVVQIDIVENDILLIKSLNLYKNARLFNEKICWQNFMI